MVKHHSAAGTCKIGQTNPVRPIWSDQFSPPIQPQRQADSVSSPEAGTAQPQQGIYIPSGYNNPDPSLPAYARARIRARTPTREGTQTDPKIAGRSGRLRNAVLRLKGSPYIARPPFRAVRGLLGHFRGILEASPIPSLQRQPQNIPRSSLEPSASP